MHSLMELCGGAVEVVAEEEVVQLQRTRPLDLVDLTEGDEAWLAGGLEKGSINPHC